MNHDLITVIVPYYNASPWLARCLDSLKAQHSKAFEFILVNDNSSDDSKAIAEAYATDKRFKLYDNEHAKGVSGARNTGLDHATGQWVTFLDADDELIGNAHNVYLKTELTGVDIVQANHLRQYAHVRKPKYVNFGGMYSLAKPPLCWWAVWNKAIKRDLLNNVRFNERLNYGEDVVFMLEVFAKAKTIKHVGQNSYATCRHFDNKQSLASSKDLKRVMALVKAIERFIVNQEDSAARQLARQHLVEIWTAKSIVELVDNA